MNRLAGPAAVAVAVAIAPAVIAAALLTGCDASSAAGPSGPNSPVAVGSSARPSSPAAVGSSARPSSPAAAGVQIRSACVTGIYDESRHEFYAMSSLVRGSRITAGDRIAEAYKLTLTDISAGTATVAGFSAAFYSPGRKLTTASQSLAGPDVLRPWQSRTLIEHPWGSSVAGRGASAGPFRAGQDGAVNTAATCKLVHWSPPVRSPHR